MSQLKIKNGNNWESIPAGGVGVPSGGTTGQVLQKSSNTDYATEWATKGTTLLWTNPNPTSSFAEQTISLDLSDYSLLFIVFTPNSTAASTVRIPVLARKADEIMVNSYINLSGTGGITLVFRYFSSSNSGVSFESGQSKAVSSSSSASTDNARCVPLYIYGIKF